MSSHMLETRRGRLLTFSLLYISEGIPLGFTATTMGTYLRQQGVGLAEIGFFTGSLYLPWAFKWAWAPLIDLIRPQRFGPHRTWIVAAQSMMILALAVPLTFDIASNVPLLVAVVAIHNIFGATQDIAIDALAVRVLPSDELGTANGFMFAAAFMGQAVGGAGALWAAGMFGFRASFVFMLLTLVFLLVFVSLRLDEPPDEPKAARADASGALQGGDEKGVVAVFLAGLREFLVDLFRGFFRSGRGPILGVLLALLPKGAVALGLTVGTTIRVDMGLNENQIALLSLLGAIGGAIGCIAGGWISDRVGHRRALACWFALTAVPNFFLLSRLSGGGVAGLTLGSFAIASVGGALTNGLQYGTSNAVFMSLTSRAARAATATAAHWGSTV
jgi:PAT family beta-lactamase induction signal transducer AmpG